ncbi:MAG: F0F1 ATP synthase subunit B [Gammaproteobacteria bacterium]
MNINLTLIGQTISFVFFVWFCMKFIWPPIVNALEARKKQIADGLAAAERGQHEQKLAEQRAAEKLREAKEKAQEIIAQAERRASEIVEEAKGQARTEGERLLEAARAEIDQEFNRAREALRAQVVTLAVDGAGKILEREIDAKAHNDLLKQLAGNL